MAWSAEQQRAYMKDYRTRNRDRMNAQARAWHAANVEHVKEQKRIYAALRRDDLNVYKSEWAQANRDKVKAAKAKWETANPDYKREWRRKYRVRYMLKNMRERASQSGRPFALTEDILTQMLMETPVCPVLGIPLVHGAGRAQDNSASIDCFYPELGYVPGNVNVISFRANMIKSVATLAEIQALAAWMKLTTVVIKERVTL